MNPTLQTENGSRTHSLPRSQPVEQEPSGSKAVTYSHHSSRQQARCQAQQQKAQVRVLCSLHDHPHVSSMVLGPRVPLVGGRDTVATGLISSTAPGPAPATPVSSCS